MQSFFHPLPAARSLIALLCCVILLPLFSDYAKAAEAGASDARSSKARTAKKATAGKPAAKQAQNRKASSSSRSKAYKKKPAASYSYDYKSCVIYNARSKKVMFTRNADRKIPPASLTKILAMYVAEDAIRNRRLKRNAKVTISQKAASAGGSRMGLRAGDKVPLDDLLKGMAVASGNDASIAVAEFIGGNEQKFVSMMNKKARAIGMKRSTFKNANGLPAPGQYTTARDMLTLARSYLKAYPGNLNKYHNKSVHVYRSKYSCNANPLLGVFEGADGLKTGFVAASGYNLIATAKRGKQRYIGVILGAPTSAVRAEQARTLMEACFTRPSTFAASATEVTTKSKGKPSSKATAAADKRGKSKKQAVASQKKGKKKSAGVRSRNTPVSKKTANKTNRPPKRQGKPTQPKGQPLVLMSYS